MESYTEQDSLDTQRIEEIKLELSKQWPLDNALSPEKPSVEPPSPSDQPSSIPPRHDRFGRRSCCLNIHPIPRLTPTRSFPVTRTPNASHNSRKMNHTFAAFDGGDTQPMDSQIYREHAKTFVRPQASWDNGESCPPETYHEGDAGHVDLFSDLIEAHHGETRNNTQASYSEGFMSDSPFRTEPASHPTRFLPPQTPALSGKNGSNGGEAVTSATKTPGSTIVASGLFNNGTGVPTLSMSQVFSNSQQFTSPQIDSARSDPVRPSPNINMWLESEAAALSSPSKMIRSEASRAASEPRDGSIPTRESREIRYRYRKMELEQRLERLNKQSDDEYEDELAREQRKAEQRELRRQIDELSPKGDSSIGASGGGLRSRRRKPFAATKSDTALFTPIQARAKPNVVEISDGTGMSDDSEDELVTEPPTVERSLARSRIEVPKTSSHGVRASQDSAKDSPTTRAGQDRAALYKHNNQILGGDDVVVADSQPQRPSQQDSYLPPPQPLEPSSNDTRITQSQISVLSAGMIAQIDARAKQALETSSVPRPPPFSSQAVEQADADDPAIPSSPPLATAEENDDEVSEDEENEEDGAVNDDFDKPDYGYDNDGGLDYIESSPRLDEEDHGLRQPHEDLDKSDDSSESDAEVEEVNQVFAKPDDPDAMVTENQEEVLEDEHMEDEHMGDERNEDAHEQEVDSHGRMRSTIPDTDPDEKDCSDLSSQVAQEQPATSTHLRDKPEPADSNETTDSNGAPLFSTARTHNSGMESPRKSQPSPAKTIAQPTPKSTRPIRLLTEIAAEPSQRLEELEDFEIPTDILDDDDKEFAEIMSGAGSSTFRPAKRLKTYRNRALRESPKKINRIPERSPTPKSPNLKSPRVAPGTDLHQEESAFTKPAIPKAGIFLPSPSKQARETPTKSPQARLIKPRRVTEIAETPQVSNKRAPAKTTKKTPKSRSRKQSKAPTTGEGDEAPVTNGHLEPTNTVDEGNGASANAAEQAREIVAPERVLARFKGYAFSYYPATCVSAFMANRVHCRIRFDDGTEDTLEDWEVRRCELRIGDIVKVDLPNMRTKNYVVRGFKDQLSAKEISDAVAEHAYPATDVYGAKTVVLEVKRRESLPQTTTQETVNVPITSIYLTSTMWPHFKDRGYKPEARFLPDLNTRPQTPSTNLSAPGTPTTVSRRQVLPTPGASVQRPIATSSVTNATGLFAGMAFALTWHGDEREKTQVIRQITVNGGQVLESGFEVLFNGTSSTKESGIETPGGKSTPRAKSRKKSTSSATPSTATTNENPPLTLTPYANSLSFVALISDRHSRRTKYIQALALSLPCLSHHWLNASLARKTLVPWSLYLLPAGESVALGGAVRSRVIEPLYEAGSTEGRLVSVLERRKKLLEGKSVLLVVKQRSRGTAYEFLTRVMGARRVKGCTSVGEARKTLLDNVGTGSGAQDEQRDGWDWVYVDGGDVGGAVKVFEGRDAPPSTSSRSKKRKRESDASAADETKGDAGIGVKVVDMGGGRTVKVVGDEFVVQSLILGALLE